MSSQGAVAVAAGVAGRARAQRQGAEGDCHVSGVMGGSGRNLISKINQSGVEIKRQPALCQAQVQRGSAFRRTAER